MTFPEWFTPRHPQISVASAAAVLKLADEGATVPFIARYRKEETGNLDEVAIRQVIDAKESWDEILKRQTFIVEEIERQGKLTPELKDQLLATFELTVLEDLYLPYKQKRKTKATVAKEAGLEPLARWLWECGHGMLSPAAGGDTRSARAGVLRCRQGRSRRRGRARRRQRHPGRAAVGGRRPAADGAQRVLRAGPRADAQGGQGQAEQPLRELLRLSRIRRRAVEAAQLASLPGHAPRVDGGGAGAVGGRRAPRRQARRRVPDGKKAPAAVDPMLERLESTFDAAACSAPHFAGAPLLTRAARAALRAYVVPAIENEVHKALRDIADKAAIEVFAENVRKLLLSAPFGPKAVLGVDPGLRTGCKLAVVDGSGAYVGSSVMHLESPAGKAGAAPMLAALVEKGGIRAVAVGNGTAGRETESFVRDALQAAGLGEVPVVMVSESGASVYSASDVAREEFPELDVTIRGAISIARRLQDPLAELVKIDPKSIGVGQYQHDVSQHGLKKSLDAVIDSCVNQVGVNLNTASTHLLSHVSGIGPGLARAIVEQRSKAGLFQSRAQLLEVPRFSKRAFEQAAGFLRIPEGAHPLDNTGVHPGATRCWSDWRPGWACRPRACSAPASRA